MKLNVLFILSSTISATWASKSPFSIVIDGGSTGSRLHIFEFVQKKGSVECVRQGSARADRPLSGFGRLPQEQDEPIDAEAVAEYLLPAFEYATNIIPSEYHASTRVWYAATAGMRLLAEEEQEAVYDAVFAGLMDHPDFVFTGMRRDDIGTLSGDMEGFYGAVAANYLKGTINANLELDHMPTSDAQAAAPMGALDMGGASTQIVFLPQSSDDDETDEQSCSVAQDAPCAPQHEQPALQRMEEGDFFATSYLSYGVDQFRERLWNTWIEEHKQAAQEGEACDAGILENPCSFPGYELEWNGYTLVGTGNSEECIRQVQRLIPHPEQAVADNLGTHVGGVEHPPIRGKFFAMSLYFFTLDSLRELSTGNQEAYDALNLSWPNPSIQELYDALDGLCSRAWTGDLEDIQHNAHAFTRPEVLPHRCIESVYMVTLLRDGYGFLPESRDITFTFLVDGSEVEWSLGMALALRAEAQEESPSPVQAMAAPTLPEATAFENNYTRQKIAADDYQQEVCEDGDCEWIIAAADPNQAMVTIA